MTSRTSSKSRAARGSSSQTHEKTNSTDKKRKKSVNPKSNPQQNQDSSISSPDRNTNLGCNQITPNSGRTKKNQRTENNEDKNEATFSIGVSDKNATKKKGRNQFRSQRSKKDGKKNNQQIHEPPIIKNTAKSLDSNLFVAQGKIYRYVESSPKPLQLEDVLANDDPSPRNICALSKRFFKNAMKIDLSGGEKEELIPADDDIELQLKNIVLKNEEPTEEELEYLKLIMDVQNTKKNIIFDKAMNGFRNALIRSIFKIEEKEIKVLKNVSSCKYFLNYDGADGSGAEETKEEIGENDTNSESKKHVLLEQNNNNLTLAVKTMLKINSDGENRDQLSMEIDSTSNNRKSKSKKKEVQRANYLREQSIHFDYYQQKNSFEGENKEKFKELSSNYRKEWANGPFKIYDLPNLDQSASKEEKKLVEKQKSGSIVDASTKQLVRSLSKTELANKPLEKISQTEWRTYVKFIFTTRSDMSIHQKAQFFCFKLAKTSPEFFKGWDYNTARIYENSNCCWSVLWFEANRYLGSNWVIEHKEILGPDPSKKRKQKKKVAIACEVEIQQSKGGMYVFSNKKLKEPKQDPVLAAQ